MQQVDCIKVTKTNSASKKKRKKKEMEEKQSKTELSLYHGFELMVITNQTMKSL